MEDSRSSKTGQEALRAVVAAVTELCNRTTPRTTLPSLDSLRHARKSLVQRLPSTGVGIERTIQHLRDEVVPGLNAASQSPNYYGFVTGGATPAAALADNIVTVYDQNVQVHLPNETVATDVEDRALTLLCELLDLDAARWPHRTFTTGATASNIIGLACAREYIIAKAAERTSSSGVSIGEHGLLAATRLAGIDSIQILTTAPHSSLGKAASLIGLGRAAVKLVGLDVAPHRFSMEKLRKALESSRTASIVAISCAEVNTGRFATGGYDEMQQIRKLCDLHGAWVHADGAFGLFARILTDPEFHDVARGCEGIELVDSITGDAHKLLNVPYDCGFILSRHRDIAERVFQNAGAAYLGGMTTDAATIASPLHIGIENSRRFRALPVYATLLAYGRQGYEDMLRRQIRLARQIARYIDEHSQFELLPKSAASTAERIGSIYIIVLFKAKDDNLNKELVQRINSMSRVYVSGTSWDGAPACRFAVANWRVDVERDMTLVRNVLDAVAGGQPFGR